MRRLLPSGVAVLLGMALAAPVVGSAPARPTTSYSAYAHYQSDPTLLGPGVHTRMWIRYETYGSSQIAQISGDGADMGQNDGGMLSDWAWAYEKVYSTEPVVGGVSPTLKDAWVHSDTLVFQCWTPGKCPLMPAEIIVKGTWTGLGQMRAHVAPDTDGVGAEWLRISRSRTAAATFEFTYPAGDGPLPIPALLMGVSISSNHFVTAKPHGSWTAVISGAGISGRASLTVPATGWATAAFSLYHLKNGVSVTARIIAGAACDATATTIKTLPGYTTTIGGTWRQEWVFNASALVRLRSAIRAGTPLWFDVSVGGSRACTRLVPGA